MPIGGSGFTRPSELRSKEARLDELYGKQNELSEQLMSMNKAQAMNNIGLNTDLQTRSNDLNYNSFVRNLGQQALYGDMTQGYGNVQNDIGLFTNDRDFQRNLYNQRRGYAADARAQLFGLSDYQHATSMIPGNAALDAAGNLIGNYMQGRARDKYFNDLLTMYNSNINDNDLDLPTFKPLG